MQTPEQEQEHKAQRCVSLDVKPPSRWTKKRHCLHRSKSGCAVVDTSIMNVPPRCGTSEFIFSEYLRTPQYLLPTELSNFDLER